MKFSYIDLIALSNYRWIKVIGYFISPRCVISERPVKHSGPLLIRDYQFRKTNKPVQDLLVVEISFFIGNGMKKKISDSRIKSIIRRGGGYVRLFNNIEEMSPLVGTNILCNREIEITTSDIKNKELFIYRLVKEKELET